jgi:hypothetical protein
MTACSGPWHSDAPDARPTSLGGCETIAEVEKPTKKEAGAAIGYRTVEDRLGLDVFR